MDGQSAVAVDKGAEVVKLNVAVQRSLFVAGFRNLSEALLEDPSMITFVASMIGDFCHGACAPRLLDNDCHAALQIARALNAAIDFGADGKAKESRERANAARVLFSIAGCPRVAHEIEMSFSAIECALLMTDDLIMRRTLAGNILIMQRIQTQIAPILALIGD